MKIYFVRHGEGKHNAQGIAGDANARLTKKGLSQAAELANTLVDCPLTFDFILSSELPRALTTAGILADELGLEIEETKLLNEVNYGNYANRPWVEYRAASEQEHVDAGAESEEQIRHRAESLIKLLSSDTRRPLLVGHENFTRHWRMFFDSTCKSVTDWRDIPNLESAKLYEFELSL